MQSIDNLNDLRLVAVVAAVGTLAGTARQLGLNHATVFRRINELEKTLGVRLFDRVKGRYAATGAGEELARAGERVEQAAQESLRKVAGQDLRPSGTVRIASTDTVVCHLLLPVVAQLRELYPDIHLQLVTANNFHNLSRRDADIAVRAAPHPPEHLVGQRIASMASAIYVAKNAAWMSAEVDFHAAPWVALDDSASGSLALRWLASQKPLDQVELRCSSLMAVLQACIAGLGLAVLPCFVGDVEPRLRRVGAPLAACASELWLLSHPDMRDTVRIKRVYEQLALALRQHAALLEGTR